MGDLTQLWSKFLADRDQEARERLILGYLPLVKHLAGRLAIFFQGHHESEELVAAGIPGLIKAIDRFDPAKGVKFETFATIKIRGAMIDWSRSYSWVPRSVYAEARRVEEALGILEQQLGRSPEEAEVAEYLKLSLTEYRRLLERISPVGLVSLESAGDLSDPGSNAALEKIEEEEMIAALAEGIKQLSERERLVITLYYYEGLTLKEIGRVLEVSESRVAQLHTRSLLKLRRYFEHHEEHRFKAI